MWKHWTNLVLHSAFLRCCRVKWCLFSWRCIKAGDAFSLENKVFLLSQGIKIHLCRPRIKFWHICYIICHSVVLLLGPLPSLWCRASLLSGQLNGCLWGLSLSDLLFSVVSFSAKNNKKNTINLNLALISILFPMLFFYLPMDFSESHISALLLP